MGARLILIKSPTAEYGNGKHAFINVHDLSDDQLHKSAALAVTRERHWSLEVIHHFQEIYRRKLFLARGFSSIFEMMTEEFGYSASAAQRRIQSMRLLTDLPELEA